MIMEASESKKLENTMSQQWQQIGNQEYILPLKSTGNPGSGLFSLASAIALVTTFSNLAGVETDVWKNGCVDDKCEELVSLDQAPLLTLVEKDVVLDIIILREEEMHGLAVAMCMLGVAVAAISSSLITKQNICT